VAATVPLKSQRRRAAALFLGLALALVLVVVFAVGVGSVSVPLTAVVSALAKVFHLWAGEGADPKWEAIILLVRLPRVLGAALIGAALATAGAALQALLRNPMADPGILGVSGGAGLGAVASIGLGFAAQSLWNTPLAALTGALTASAVILGLSFRGGKLSIFTLILAGLAVSAFFAAGTSLVLSLVSRDRVVEFIFWSMGSLAGLRWESIGLVVVPLLLGIAGLFVFGRDLNVLLLGDAEAQSVGLDVPRTRLLVMLLVSVTTAATVCLCGPVGFVGLMVPPMLRLLIGPDNRLLLPASALGGAVFLVSCDVLARVFSATQEVNVGIVTSLVGAPYFLFLLLRSARREELF